MAITDLDEVDDGWLNISSNNETEETNRFLKDDTKAYGLVSKFIGTGKYQETCIRKMNGEIETIISNDLLSGVEHIRLHNEAQLQKELSKLAERIEEVAKYNALKNKAVVGIGGKFSSGKSEFINSILHVDLLPTEQSPTTSIPTYLVKSDSDSIKALSNEGNWINLDEEAMQALTHRFYEKYNMGFANFINSLLITKKKLPYNDLSFLDTPGYNKADSHGGVTIKDLSDEKKAFDQLKNVDYLIWLMDIENGVITEDDMKFIENLALENKPLIVINKMDKRPDSDIKQIITAVSKALKKRGIHYFAVTAYSSFEKKEYGDNAHIHKYLLEASEKKYSDEDVVIQLFKNCDEINKSFDSTIEENSELCKMLFNEIKKTDDVFHVKSLVEEYCLSEAYVENLMLAKGEFLKKLELLKKKLDSCNVNVLCGETESPEPEKRQLLVCKRKF